MAREPLRVCIGTEPRTEIARKVLAFSIRKHLRSDRDVEILPLTGGDWSGTGPLRQFTGFSLLRWSVPERCAYRGRAIYLDADQLCLGDLAELWDATVDAPSCVSCTWRDYRPRLRFFPLLRTRRRLPETSVMVLDCARARDELWSVERIERLLRDAPTAANYDRVMHASYLEPPPTPIDSRWNVMDAGGTPAASLLDPGARLLHFTRVSTQPWFDPDHPAAELWGTHLADALEAGALEHEELAAASARFTLERGRPDGLHPAWEKRFAS